MKAALPSGFGIGIRADNIAPQPARRGDAMPHVASTRARIQREIVKNLTAENGIGLGEVLVYGAPDGRVETWS